MGKGAQVARLNFRLTIAKQGLSARVRAGSGGHPGGPGFAAQCRRVEG
jgi:hypothetical protein